MVSKLGEKASTWDLDIPNSSTKQGYTLKS